MVFGAPRPNNNVIARRPAIESVFGVETGLNLLVSGWWASFFGTSPSALLSSLIVRVGGHLQPGVQRQLLEDVVHMALDRVRRDAQPVGDLLVAQAIGDRVNDLAFPRGHPYRSLYSSLSAGQGLGGYMGEQGARHHRGQHAHPVGHGQDRCDEHLDRGVLSG